MIRGVALVACLFFLSVAGRGDAQVNPLCVPQTSTAGTASFQTGTEVTGVISLFFTPAMGSPVTFYECVKGAPQKLGTETETVNPTTVLDGAAPWLCGRTTRSFVGTATLPDGTFKRGFATARTPSCRHRFALTAPARGTRHKTAEIKVRDRWAIGGYTTRLCITAPDKRKACSDVRLRQAVTVATKTLHLTQRGVYQLDLAAAGYHERDAVAVGVKPVAPPRDPVVLATGDSTMEGVDSGLGDQLEGYDVQSEVHPGQEISNADWPTLAERQVAGRKPAVTVISIGAAEGFNLKTADGRVHPCCDTQWVAEYQRRVHQMMRTYTQHGKAQVYFLTVALPRDPARTAIVSTCNEAIARAAKGVTGAKVLRVDKLFSPAGYTETFRDGGRDVLIREIDGVHLNATGTAIEAREVAKAIRGERTLIP